jgi:pimeloyl-ACP methyl ester carboxylesterase
VSVWISDPDVHDQPVGSLLSDEWITRTAARVKENPPADPPVPWDPRQGKKPGNTTHLVVVDGAGNLVSLTQSINDFYGAGVMAPRSGILLNNHLGDFSADSSRRNSVRPFQRPASNMAATIVRKHGKPVLVIGSPGGPRIAPTMAQVLTAVLDGRLPLEAALKAPRFFPQGSTLVIESRLPASSVDGLREKGWKIAVNGSLNNYFGGVHAVAIDSATRRLTGCADPRRDGMPAGDDGSFDLISAARINGTQTDYHGFVCTDFLFEGRAAKVVQPRAAAEGRPWLWRARFWGHEPQTELALLARGFHLVYCDVEELFGNDEALRIWDGLYRMLTSAGLSRRSSLIAFSRGGVYAYRWAARYPERVACIYADAPVLDLKSWPGGKGKGHGNPERWEQFKRDFALRTEEEAMAFRGNPLDLAEQIARGGFPMLHICGDADITVPIDENTDPFEKKILQYGGSITVIRKRGVAHHPHSLVDPTPIVEFILRATAR